MVEEKKGEKEENLRYKYIGFEVFPLKPKKFWRNAEEEKKYLEETKKRKEKGEREERDHSVVFVPIFTQVEKWILSLTSVLMILSVFLPWFTFTRGESAIRYNAIQYIINFGTTMTYSGLGGPLLGFLMFIFMFVILSSFIFGILNLLALYSKTNSESVYLQKLKRSLRLNFVPLFLWLIAVILTIFGMTTPLATAFGVNQLKDTLNVVTLLSISGVGLWISLGCWVMNSVKANDL
jgi:hypothetical protein